jgi:hypothetical protein
MQLFPTFPMQDRDRLWTKARLLEGGGLLRESAGMFICVCRLKNSLTAVAGRSFTGDHGRLQMDFSLVRESQNNSEDPAGVSQLHCFKKLFFAFHSRMKTLWIMGK